MKALEWIACVVLGLGAALFLALNFIAVIEGVARELWRAFGRSRKESEKHKVP